jgi:hypothetical protein
MKKAARWAAGDYLPLGSFSTGRPALRRARQRQSEAKVLMDKNDDRCRDRDCDPADVANGECGERSPDDADPQREATRFRGVSGVLGRLVGVRCHESGPGQKGLIKC